MVRKLNNKERKLIVRIIRGILFVFLGIVIFLILLTGYLYLDRDNISSRLLLTVNKYTRGELRFESIAFNPFVQFPSMSLLVKEVIFYEHELHERNQNEVPLAKIERLYAAVNVKELLRGRADVSEIRLERGQLNLIMYPDSSLNVINAIEILKPLPGPAVEKSSDSIVLKAGISRADEAKDESDSSTFEINLDYIKLEEIRIEFENRLERNRANLDVKKLRAQFEYTKEAIRSNLNTDIVLEILQLSGFERIDDSELHLETSMVYSRSEKNLLLDPSLLVINRAKLNIEGELNFAEKGSIDLKFDGSDDDFALSQLILSEMGLKNLEKGDLYFRGTVKDNNLKGVPVLDLSFGIDDVRLFVPLAGDYINDLNLAGRFNTGEKTDLSAAWIRIDTIYAELPDGFVNGTMYARNLVAPEFNLDWKAEFNLAGIDQVFKFDFMDSMYGHVTSRIFLEKAGYDPDSGKISAGFFDLDLDFDSASIVLPEIMSISNLDGRIRHHEGMTKLYEIRAKVDDSDFYLDGEIQNAMHLAFGTDTIITADLALKSELFDLPGFLDFVPEVRESFPYRIKDVDIDCRITTSTERFMQMKPNPSMTFEFSHLEGEVENLLPPLGMRNGVFELNHRNGRTYLDFKDFNMEIADSRLDVDLEYHSPAKRRDYLAMDIGIEGLNPTRLLWDEETDTIPDFLDGMLYGSFQLELHFPHDSIQTLKKIDLRDADLSFINASDTIEIRSFYLLAEDIIVNTEKDPNPFASLTASIMLRADRSAFNSFEWVGYNFDVEADDGVFTVHPGQNRLFGKEGEGYYILDPFAEVPNFNINYKVDQYDVKDLMGHFMEDTLIVGKMDLGLDVSLDIHENQKALAGLNGSILLKGKDLTLYGMELDKLIRKFERSQNFNLVDLGAVMFMGPAGIAVSKGGSYADMIVSDFSENSPVTQIRSELIIEDGRVLLKDLAFSTEENRVAASGWIDMARDSLDITFAVIDQNGCSVIDQRLFGSMEEPQRSKVRFLETIIAPVTNLVQAALGNNCDPFYTGVVEHPAKK